jgi:rubrerythrin
MPREEAMNREEFDRIIDYAIEREKEAVQFYHDLQDSAHFAERQKLLSNLEHMEEGHVIMLEGIRDQDLKQMLVPDVENLHLSDYLIQDEPEGELTYQDILIIAMKREESSNRLYSDMAEKTTDNDVKKLFQKLASEEAKHKLLFEKMYDEEILTQG